MGSKAYKVVGNRTAADVVANNDEVIETGYTLQEAKIAILILIAPDPVSSRHKLPNSWRKQ